MANILLITNFYPPIESIATNRMIAFSKYLQEFGHTVFVITVGEQNKTVDEQIKTYYLKNSTCISLANTNKKENIIKHNFKCLYNIFLSSCGFNPYSNWEKRAIKEGNRIIKRNNINIVISSYPDISTMAIAYKLKTMNSIKWIADMRDALWSETVAEKFRKKLIRIGTQLLNHSDVILSVSKPQLLGYKRILRNDAKIFSQIRNGYDFDVKIKNIDNNFFHIIYAGNFYGERKPYNFFAAIEMLIKEKRIDLKVTIVGNHSPIKIPKELKNTVFNIDRLPYEKLIKYLQENADVLLLISPTSIEKGTYTGKLFDYIGCYKPILGLVPCNDVAAKLIVESDLGYVSENENIVSIKNVVWQAYSDWRQKKPFCPNEFVIQKHHRKEQIQLLDNIIREIEDI